MDHPEPSTDRPSTDAALGQPGAYDAAPTPGRTPSTSLLFGAVGAVALLAGGGIWAAVAARDDGSAPGPRTTTTAATAAPAPFWGRQWRLVSLSGAGAPAVPARASRGPLVLDLVTQGQVSFTGCNGGTGGGHLDGSTLVIDEGFLSTEMACTDADGRLLMAYDEWMRELLESRPAATIAAATLTVSSPLGTATFGDPQRPTDPEVTVPDDAPDCAVSSGTPDPEGTDPGAPLTTVPASDCTPDGPVGDGPKGPPMTIEPGLVSPGPSVEPGAGSSPGSPGDADLPGAAGA